MTVSTPTSHALLHRKIEAVLPRVEKPSRYLGNELNAARKASGEFDVRVALVFPEVYEIGMSWPGQQILYNLLNSKPGVYAERCYAFWPDMEARMREEGIPSFSLETWTPLREFDIVGITLQYELVFTNILAILDMAGIPIRSRDRNDDDPVIIAGGPVAYNAEPIADFLDAVALGDGEDVFLEICDARREWKASGEDRHSLLKRLSRIGGVYVPAFHEVEYESAPVEGWTMPAIASIRPTQGAPEKVRRRWVEDLNRVPFPESPIVPLAKTVHNRLGIEVQRGCTRACRFCQAGYIYRPERQRDSEQVKKLVAASLKSTGYDELSLLSLSIGDYGCLDPLLGDLLGPDPARNGNVSVSLPSIRVDTLTEGIVDKIASTRRTGFTVAPEAGSPRLRDVINKPLTEEQIARAAEIVFQRGWSHIKFYYMIGIPTETEDDVMGIVRTARACQAIGRKYNRKADIVVSTSTFVPKPFTPFQWEPQIPAEVVRQRQQLLKDELAKTRLSYRWHESKESFLEAVLSRGDRRLCDAVERAFQLGARFDGWQEHFRDEVWRQAFAETGIEPGFYAHRRFDLEEVLPWEHIDCGVTKDWLQRDYLSGVRGKFVPDCATGRCYDCGVCDFEVVKNRTFIPKESGRTPQGMPPKGIGAHPQPVATEGRTPLHALLPARNRGVAETVGRFRLQYAKTDRAVYLSHLDLNEHLLRALTRAGIRLAWSRGLRPKPKISYGPALMTGAASVCELVDIEAFLPLPDGDLPARLNAGLPDGVRVLAVRPLAPGVAGPGAAVRGMTFEVAERLPGVLPPPNDLQDALDAFFARETVEVERNNKVYDVRQYVESAERLPGGLRFSIAYTPTGSAKPSDVLRAILRLEDPGLVDRLQITKTGMVLHATPAGAAAVT